jgi:hypothetical protein
MYLFFLPLTLEMPAVLALWIKNVPEHAVLFTRLILIDALIESVSYPIASMIQATGKVKLYQSVVGGFLLLNLPISWMFLVFGAPVYSVTVVAICLTFIAFITRLLIARLLIAYSIFNFFCEVLLPVCAVSLLSIILPLFLCYILDPGFLRVFIVACMSVISTCVFMYLIALNMSEKKKIKSILSDRLKYICKIGDYTDL